MARLTKNVVAQLLAAARARRDNPNFAMTREAREYLDKGIEWLEAKQRDRVEG